MLVSFWAQGTHRKGRARWNCVCKNVTGSLRSWCSAVIDGWVIPDDPADNSEDYWKPYGLVFCLLILIHFNLHCTVNTPLADGRRAESTHQDDMNIFVLIHPCTCWGGSGLYCQPLARVVLGGCCTSSWWTKAFCLKLPNHVWNVLLLTPNYITANCSGWCCIKCSWRELPPAPREGHWSPDFCVDTDPAGLRRRGSSARMHLWASVWAAGTHHPFNSQAHGRGKPKASQSNINKVFSGIYQSPSGNTLIYWWWVCEPTRAGCRNKHKPWMKCKEGYLRKSTIAPGQRYKSRHAHTAELSPC